MGCLAVVRTWFRTGTVAFPVFLYTLPGHRVSVVVRVFPMGRTLLVASPIVDWLACRGWRSRLLGCVWSVNNRLVRSRFQLFARPRCVCDVITLRVIALILVEVTGSVIIIGLSLTSGFDFWRMRGVGGGFCRPPPTIVMADAGRGK